MSLKYGLLFLVVSATIICGDQIMRKYRYATAQQVWEKAKKKHLEPDVMQQLEEELIAFDKRAMNWKREKYGEDGEHEGVLREEILEIMRNFGIISHDANNNINNKGAGDRRNNKPREKFGHFELDKLWHSIQEEEVFTQDELRQLEVEFHHHKDKLTLYNTLKEDLEHYKVAGENDAIRKDAKTFKEKSSHYDKLSDEVDESMERIQLTIKNAQDKRSTPFTELRVARLWELAKNQSMSEDELESLKEELQHFQTRIQKHRFFNEKLEQSKSKLDYLKEAGDEITEDRMMKHQRMQDKVDDLENHMKKYKKSLTSKIQHGEL